LTRKAKGQEVLEIAKSLMKKTTQNSFWFVKIGEWAPGGGFPARVPGDGRNAAGGVCLSLDPAAPKRDIMKLSGEFTGVNAPGYRLPK
jgi:hypothetical protein